MADNDRCEIHEMLSCAICLGHDKPERYTADDVDWSRKFMAQFEGRCALDKTHRTTPGEIIAALRDGSGYVCERCLEVIVRG